MVQSIIGNITTANFTSTPTVQADSGFGRNTVIDMGTQLTLRGVPIGPGFRSLLLYTTAFSNLEKDSSLVTLAAYQRPEIIEVGTTEGGMFAINVSSFTVYNAPYLTPNNNNISGFGFSKSALMIATRLPGDYTSIIPGASYGNVNVIYDAGLGIYASQVQYVNHDKGTAQQRLSLMYGTAAGQNNAGQILQAASGTGSSQ